MARKRSAEDLSEEELRRLLVNKQRAARQERLEYFKRTGQITVSEPGSGGPQPTADVEVYEGDEAVEIRPMPSSGRGKSLFNRFLLVIEIGAVLGLLLVLANGVNLIRSLNREVASALRQPTLTPTPLISAIVLPSGHTPPNEPGGAQPNDSEIPEHLRPLVESMAALPVPTQAPEQATRIQISAIDVDAPVVQGDGWEQLKQGVAQHPGTPNPGQKGNLVLSAHNDVFGEIFRDLDQLKTGDEVTLFTKSTQYTYQVTGSQIVSPTQTEVMGATKDATLTLISCYPYMVDNQRIVVTASLVNHP